MLTRKQLQLLDFINKRMERDGVPPSFDEMKDALDLRSKSGIHRLITALEERGFIRRLPHRARALEIVKLPDAMGKPGLHAEGDRGRQAEGAAAADGDAGRGGGDRAAGDGAHRGGRADRGDQRSVAPRGGAVDDAVGRGHHYALEVKGDSMIEAGINDGDIVVIREGSTADNGDIVVALVEEQEATLKRFRRSGASIALEAANPAYETRVFATTRWPCRGGSWG